ncbi:TRL-like family protein [Vulgatibacter sp.]|uniref:TRL-like family protein n=1 Tax=Vulgatibacter sp. TaxID=1971226 RepID=UPI003564DCD2
MKRFAIVAVAAGLLSGCAAGSMRSPVNGFLYTSAKAGEAAAGPVRGSKSGRACATSILGLVGTGDASISQAASNGGIKEISHVDADVENILGIWAQYCTVVYGE